MIRKVQRIDWHAPVGKDFREPFLMQRWREEEEDTGKNNRLSSRDTWDFQWDSPRQRHKIQINQDN